MCIFILEHFELCPLLVIFSSQNSTPTLFFFLSYRRLVHSLYQKLNTYELKINLFQAYSSMSPNGEPQTQPILGSAVTTTASLPPMSSFRGSATVPSNQGQSATSPASLQYSHSPGAPVPVAVPVAATQPNQVLPPQANPQQQPASTNQDTLGKTLASVVSSRVRLISALFYHYITTQKLSSVIEHMS
jgi:hypothetical protein